MPDLNPYANANTAGLNNPVAPPQKEAQFNSLAMSSGIQPMSPIYQGGGTNTYDPSASGGRTSVDAWDTRGENGQMGSAYTTMDVGGNVAGLTSSGDSEKWKLDIPEVESEGEVETNEFIEAIDEGGKSAGRIAKRADRRQDRADRQEISDEYLEDIKDEKKDARKEAGFLSNEWRDAGKQYRRDKKANRKKRRNKRHSQLDTRKASWDLAKGDSQIED